MCELWDFHGGVLEESVLVHLQVSTCPSLRVGISFILGLEY
jgi:hypothetical protein